METKIQTCQDSRELVERTQPSRQVDEFYQREQGSMRNLIKYTLRFVLLALRALAHPETKREWRFAYAYFVFPVFWVGGFVLLVTLVIGLLIPFPWNLLGVLLWWFYMLGEGFLFYVEGNGFEQWDRWIERGGE